MPLGPYLIRRGNALVFRRRVPKGHAEPFSTPFLQVPLRTHLLPEGRIRAMRLAALADAAFAMLEVREEAGMLDGTTEERVILELMRFELDATEALRALAPVRGPAEVAAALALAAATRETLRAALVYNDYAAVRSPLAAACARLGLAVDPEAPDGRRLARRAARALIEVSDENARREQGLYTESGLIAVAHKHAASPAPDAARLPVALPPLPLPAVQTAAPELSAAPLPTNPLPAVPLAPAILPAAGPAAPVRDALPLGAGAGPSLVLPAPVAETVGPAPAPTPARMPASMWTPAERQASKPAEPETGGVSVFAARVAAEMDAERARNAALGIRPAAARMHMGRAFDAFIVDMVAEKGESWKVNSAPNVRSTKTLFIEINGDFWTDAADELHFALFRNLLRAVPKDHHKSPNQKPILEEIAELDETDAIAIRRRDAELREAGVDRGTRETELATLRTKRMRVATAYRHQQDAQRFCRWGVARGLFPRNFMQGLMWSKKTIQALQREESDNRRLAWGDKAAALFGSRIFTGVLDDKGDPLFWAPLIARLAGLREEEVLQLKEKDIDTEDGVPVFRIRQGEGQVLKSEAARRIVPIHRALLVLGFLELVAQRRRERQEWLFPQVERSASRDRLTGIFTKTFTRYRIEIGVYDPNRDFHSLRQDFNVSLTDADVPLFVRKRLMGHEINDVTEVNYNAAGTNVHKLAEYVDRIRFDISGIRAPFTSSLTLPFGPALKLVKR
jgi:integrase